MRSETAAARAEVAALFRHGPRRDAERLVLRRDVDKPDHLPPFEAFLLDRFVGDDDEIPRLAEMISGELRYIDAEHGKCRVRTVHRRQVETRDLRAQQILRRRLLRALQQLLAIDDLQHAVGVGAIAEVDAIAPGAGRYG